MFDEIFKRWIETGNIYQSDIIPILLEYDSEFNDKQIDPQALTLFLNSPTIQYINLNGALERALKYVAIKKGYIWEEMYDRDGFLMKRFMNT